MTSGSTIVWWPPGSGRVATGSTNGRHLGPRPPFGPRSGNAWLQVGSDGTCGRSSTISTPCCEVGEPTACPEGAHDRNGGGGF